MEQVARRVGGVEYPQPALPPTPPGVAAALTAARAAVRTARSAQASRVVVEDAAVLGAIAGALGSRQNQG
jgi:hypothetical protein